GRVRIGEQEHVALVEPLEAADARAVESDTLSEGILVEFIPGYRKMLPLAQHVAKAKIDHVDLMRRNCLEDIAGFIFHCLRLWCTHTDSLSGLFVISSYGFLVSSFLSMWREQRLFW